MNTNETLKISAKEVKTNTTKFLSFSTKVGETWYKVKFPQTITTKPTEKGIWYVTVNKEMCHIQNGQMYTAKDGKQKRGDPTIWVNEVVECRQETLEERKAKNLEQMNNIFDNIADLPF